KKRDAYGAEIRVEAGGRQWVRTLQPAESYLSSSSPWAHVGLGSISRIDSVEVRWPDGPGEVERFTVSVIDRLVTLRRGEGTVISALAPASKQKGQQP
ncbi:MAG: ASPIC/UnbV domain-containing protein, partial [Gemmataceae bacterium]|nr:ASPIC/UnbV domain-containing protein [Gemmataceae bacterium]